MRQWPHNRTFWKDYLCVRASDNAVPNQSIPRVPLWLTNQIAAAISIYNMVSRTRTHFPCQPPASRFTCRSGVSSITLSLALLYTYVLVTVNTVSLQPTLTFSLPGGIAYTRDDKRILQSATESPCDILRSRERDFPFLLYWANFAISSQMNFA